ncbi:unnamed protein product [Anisakis simplex]|uniref:Peroxisomal biogenesis factor 11 n=1 Tax=Anisakis simplex TaxID=6269 RepID=A0A0M3JVH5_ANISI|nr:unnamed protein product [Anisakis simplex]
MVVTLDDLVRILSQYSGRDKTLRIAYSILILYATHIRDEVKSKRLLALSKQLRSARLVLKQFNHAAALHAAVQLTHCSREDLVDFLLQVLARNVNLIHGFVESLAWLADANIISLDAVRLFGVCKYLWMVVLFSSIIRLSRILLRKGALIKCCDETITLLGQVFDFVSVVSALPSNILWAGRLNSTQTTTFSLIASLIALYRCF